MLSIWGERGLEPGRLPRGVVLLEHGPSDVTKKMAEGFTWSHTGKPQLTMEVTTVIDSRQQQTFGSSITYARRLDEIEDTVRPPVMSYSRRPPKTISISVGLTLLLIGIALGTAIGVVLLSYLVGIEYFTQPCR